jgi:hypothetical protein
LKVCLGWPLKLASTVEVQVLMMLLFKKNLLVL